MTTTTHTPGPWQHHGAYEIWTADRDLCKGQSFERIALAVAPNGRPIEEVAANARLIAAAPEILYALQVLLADAEDLTSFQAYKLHHDDERHPLHEAVMAARAAIAKATGGPS